MAWNIGANDVANAMGTSVGSGALSLKEAVLIAGILEFCGAFFLGSHVSATIEKGIVNTESLQSTPLVLVCGMLSSLISAGVWLQIASYFGWPVSTTHSIVGSVVGFGALVIGFDGVYWENVAYIACSWIISPFIGGLLSYIIFTILLKKIFYAPHPLKAAQKITPLLVFLVMVTITFALFFNGLGNFHIPIFLSLILSLVIGISGAFLSRFYLRKIKDNLEPKENSVRYEYREVEKIFAHLQLISACVMAFSHGANDVANAIGPMAAALRVLLQGIFIDQTEAVPMWALALGGFGIVIGLATWGWRVMETIGKKLTELTPTRGFAAEFGAAITILVASRLGLPISATHTLVGSVLGVGFARGIEALNLTIMRDILVSWVVTIPIGACLTVVVYLGISTLFGI